MSRGRLPQQLGRKTPRALRNMLIRWSNGVLRALDADPAATAGVAPRAPAPPVAALEPVWPSPPVPVPDGLALDEIEQMFRTWSVEGEPAGHLDLYVEDSIWRFCYTWDLVRDASGR